MKLISFIKKYYYYDRSNIIKQKYNEFHNIYSLYESFKFCIDIYEEYPQLFTNYICAFGRLYMQFYLNNIIRIEINYDNNRIEYYIILGMYGYGSFNSLRCLFHEINNKHYYYWIICILY